MSSQRVALWTDRPLRFALGAAATLAGAGLGVVRNKWLASHLDTSGLGVLAQVSAIQIWLGTAAGLGLSLPVARAVGAAWALRDDAAIRRTVITAFTLAGAAGLAVVALGLGLAPQLSTALFGTPAYATLIRIAMLGVAGLAFQDALTGLFAGRSDIRAPLTLTLAGGIPATVLTLVLVPRFGLMGGAIGATILFPAGVLGALLIHRRAYASAFAPLPHPRFDLGEARALLGVAAASLVMALIDQGTMLAIRSHYLRTYGTSANGLLQAALSLTQMLGAMIYVYLAGYAFGKVSGAGDANGIRAYTQRQWTPLVLLSAAILGTAMVAAAPMLHLLYSDRFDPARPMMAWTLLGEFAKVTSRVWVLGALPLGGMRLLVPLAMFYPVAMVAAYAVLVRLGVGTLSLPWAYVAAGVAGLVVNAVVMSRRGVTISARGGALLAAGLVALSVLAWVVGR